MHLPTAAQRPRAWVIVSICALALIAGFLVLHDREEPEPRGLITLEAGATKNPPTPRNFTGYGFDQCLTPTQKAMDAWLENSAFWAVGIYISGNSRWCRNQPNLTPTWVSTQLAKGWRLLPITLGPQAWCHPGFPRYKDDPVIKKDPADNYAKAKAQGVAEAKKAVKAAQALGIVETSTLWYDLEAFNTKKAGCRASAMQFLSGWTEQLHRQNYVSGAYSSGASGIVAIDNARVNNKTFTAPDQIWVADWSGSPMKFRGKWLRDDAWLPGGRMHQYRGGHDEVHGGVRINIDSNFLDLGKGTSRPAAVKHCNGIRINFRTYPNQSATKNSPEYVQALKCLLREQGYKPGLGHGRWTLVLEEALKSYRADNGRVANPNANKPTWAMLLSAGPKPLVKYGARRDGVRRLQRALNVLVGEKLPITGYFGPETTRSVKLYQLAHKRDNTGVVTPELWGMLQSGS